MEPLAGQESWLLPLALLGLVALAGPGRPRLREDKRVHALILWGMWLLIMGIFFSVAGFFHEYYLTVMAPAVAALCGIGLVVMWRDYRGKGWRGWLLPAFLLLTAVEQILILASYPSWGRWMIPLLTVPCLLAAGVLLHARPLRAGGLGARRPPSPASPGHRVGRPGTCPHGVGGVLPILQERNQISSWPVRRWRACLNGSPGEPTTTNSPQNGGSPVVQNPRAPVDPALVRYLEEHQGRAQVLVVTDSNADGLILATNKPVMPLAGFSSYPLTASEAASLVASGTVRFFLLNQMQNQIPEGVQVKVIGSGPGNDQPITTWVKQHCKAVPPSLWQSSSTGAGTGASDQGGANQLYDCATTH